MEQLLIALGVAIVGALQAIAIALIQQHTTIKHDEANYRLAQLTASAHAKKKLQTQKAPQQVMLNVH